MNDSLYLRDVQHCTSVVECISARLCNVYFIMRIQSTINLRTPLCGNRFSYFNLIYVIEKNLIFPNMQHLIYDHSTRESVHNIIYNYFLIYNCLYYTMWMFDFQHRYHNILLRISQNNRIIDDDHHSFMKEIQVRVLLLFLFYYYFLC